MDPSTGWYFAGSLIVQAILEDLASSSLVFAGVAGPLRHADEVVVAGGAGAVYLQDDIKRWVPSAVAVNSAICDSCVLPYKNAVPAIAFNPDAETLRHNTTNNNIHNINNNTTTNNNTTNTNNDNTDNNKANSNNNAIDINANNNNDNDNSNKNTNNSVPDINTNNTDNINTNNCTDTTTCLPSVSIAMAEIAWNLTHSSQRPVWCSESLPVWRCLFADQLLLASIQRSRVFVLSTQLSDLTLKQHGVDINTTSGKIAAAALALSVRDVAHNVDFSFSSGCIAHNTTETSVIGSDYYFFAKLNCTEQSNPHPFAFEPTQAITEFITSRKITGSLRCVAAIDDLANCVTSSL